MQVVAAESGAYHSRFLPRFTITNAILVGTVAVIAYLVLAPIVFLIWKFSYLGFAFDYIENNAFLHIDN
jgi:uncharacterized membrane protein